MARNQPKGSTKLRGTTKLRSEATPSDESFWLPSNPKEREERTARINQLEKETLENLGKGVAGLSSAQDYPHIANTPQEDYLPREYFVRNMQELLKKDPSPVLFNDPELQSAIKGYFQAIRTGQGTYSEVGQGGNGYDLKDFTAEKINGRTEIVRYGNPLLYSGDEKDYYKQKGFFSMGGDDKSFQKARKIALIMSSFVKDD